jgi:AmiR/NasT family two-component response regulator
VSHSNYDVLPMSVRVLVVEDEAILAIDIAEQLSDAGFEIIGPAPSVGKALRLIEEVGCDIAVLDFNLRDETAESIALVLQTLRIPFLFLSGVSRERLPQWCGGAMLLPKPVRLDALLPALQQSLHTARNGISPQEKT